MTSNTIGVSSPTGELQITLELLKAHFLFFLVTGDVQVMIPVCCLVFGSVVYQS